MGRSVSGLLIFKELTNLSQNEDFYNVPYKVDTTSQRDYLKC